MRTAIVAITASSTVLLAHSAFGHHSVAMFDQEQEVAIEGVVKELELVNPHSWFHLVVTEETGREVEWSFEMQSITLLERQGFTPDLVEPGTPVTIFAHPLKDGSRGGQFTAMKLADGSEFRYGPAPAGSNIPRGAATAE